MNPSTGKFHNVDRHGKLMEDVSEAGLKTGDPVPPDWIPWSLNEQVTVTKLDGTAVRMRVWKVKGTQITFRPVPKGAM